jgi:hypothetical protein
MSLLPLTASHQSPEHNNILKGQGQEIFDIHVFAPDERHLRAGAVGAAPSSAPSAARTSKQEIQK